VVFFQGCLDFYPQLPLSFIFFLVAAAVFGPFSPRTLFSSGGHTLAKFTVLVGSLQNYKQKSDGAAMEHTEGKAALPLKLKISRAFGQTRVRRQAPFDPDHVDSVQK
jgi:hypothetical protein